MMFKNGSTNGSINEKMNRQNQKQNLNSNHHHHHNHNHPHDIDTVNNNNNSKEIVSEQIDQMNHHQSPKHNNDNNNIDITSLPTPPSQHQWKMNWLKVFLISFIHINAIVGIYLGITRAMIGTLVWYFVLIQFGATGIICGAHRLWTHRTYKAHWMFRIFLMLCNTLALQHSIYDWCLWHRVHHKYSDTDADPHNAKRGFFFSQIGWVMVKPHPEYLAKSKLIDMTDLRQDKVVWFQHRFYIPLVAVVWYIVPVFVPWYFWSENFIVANSFNFFRHVLSIHQTSLVNSAAHLYGKKTYDRRIMATKHYFTTTVTMGEAYHNYHHAFPWDYSASEFGWAINYNPMTGVIDLAAALGLAWDRKKVSTKLVEERIRKYGDIDRLNIATRAPPGGVALDTICGVFLLFWALWIILTFKWLYHHYAWCWHMPGIDSMVQMFDQYQNLDQIWSLAQQHYVPMLNSSLKLW